MTANAGLRVIVAPASDGEVLAAEGQTFDAAAIPLTDMLLSRLGGRAIVIGDSWACRFTFGIIDSSGDFAAIDITAWTGLVWEVFDPITDELLFTRTAGTAISGNPAGWEELELETPASGVALIRIDTSESLVTTGGMYQHRFILTTTGKLARERFGSGQVEILPDRPS